MGTREAIYPTFSPSLMQGMEGKTSAAEEDSTESSWRVSLEKSFGEV